MYFLRFVSAPGVNFTNPFDAKCKYAKANSIKCKSDFAIHGFAIRGLDYSNLILEKPNPLLL